MKKRKNFAENPEFPLFHEKMQKLTLKARISTIFFVLIWLSFSKMTQNQTNKLSLRNIVWDHHTKSLIPFGVN